ncbi:MULTISPECIES: energy-coupling factor ABC transporter substrate-binding protein [unclassified Duganella]|uniref:energy-coupling factor ABC transporter substrate-binding protein n=1 Tax=unclassified Duganella TaxID=2636909 RepID=UPI0006F31F3B|nr:MULTISPECIES: energy-coupling factor ABC transporter substrate-binding protein [unclassified Duganella]KQV43131.1 cobalamin biosynthesis protein CbiN [Duganella sp. Root336D2]KRB97257.1 cobalamin biosynthesis protein CbiN [Duganella sp. Root198D2]
MKARTALTWVAIVLLTVLPLWFAVVPPAEPGTEPPAAFGGADARAQQAIVTIAPNYKPWFVPLFEPPSGEIASLLFALQAAAGAGVIGFWLGMSMAREREQKRVRPAPEPGQGTHAD